LRASIENKAGEDGATAHAPRRRLLAAAYGLGVYRAGRWIVRDIDIEVSAGEIVTLIGPNGGGKSTTAKALLGLIAPDVGKVDRAAGLKVGYVPQRFQIDVTLPLDVDRLMTLTQRHDPEMIRTALKRVNAGHLAGRAIGHLSGGELQRVLLARAIAGEPDLLILDEPVQGVDYAGEIALYELIGKIRDELGCGVLLISHDLHIVMAATDRVVCIEGHVCCSGPPRHVMGDAAFQRLFGQRGAQSLAVYRHHHDHVHDGHGHIKPLSEDDASEAGGPNNVR
jgi:zinc transport system ATP-binding protein